MTEALAINLNAPCWLFQGALDRDGYGQVKRQQRQWKVHRYVWTLMRGAIPEGLEPDHLCRVHHCINPQHMELVTNRVNILRGMGQGAINARKTHCKQGHPFDQANTYLYPNGERACRLCQKANRRRWYEAHRR